MKVAPAINLAPRFRRLPCELAAIAVLVTGASRADPLAPPVAPRVAHHEILNGNDRSDDWFWLRDKTNPEVVRYLDAENAYSEHALAPLHDLQETLYKEMLGRIRQTDLSVPYREHGFWYYTRTVEGKQYPIYCRKRGTLEAHEEILIDGNELARGHRYMSISEMSPSDDGNRLAFAVDTTGYRQYALVVKDLRRNTLFADQFPKIVDFVWAADSKTLFYTVEDGAKRPYRLYRHALGATLEGCDRWVHLEHGRVVSVSTSRPPELDTDVLRAARLALASTGSATSGMHGAGASSG